MSDYLSNLVARTRNAAEVIQPRLASRFEPVQTQGSLGRAQPSIPSTLPSTTDAELEFNAEHAVGSSPASLAQSLRSQSLRSRAPVGQPVVVPVPQFSSNDDRPSATKRATAMPTVINDMDEAAPAMQSASPRPPAPRLGDFEMRPTPVLPWAAERPIDQAAEDGHRQSQSARWQMVEVPLTRVESVVESVYEIERIVETVGTGYRAETDKREAHATGEMITGELGKPTYRAATHSALAQPQPLARVIAQPNVTIAPTIRAATSVATQPARNEISAAAPTIQVTIGRIEVRATPPTPAAGRKANTAPIMSLDDYLRARNGGNR